MKTGLKCCSIIVSPVNAPLQSVFPSKPSYEAFKLTDLLDNLLNGAVSCDINCPCKLQQLIVMLLLLK